MIYLELLLLSLVVVFVVDLSGFTDSWRGLIARWLKVTNLKPLKPFDCSLCMTWWTCVIYALATGRFSLPVLAYSALLSYLSLPVGQVLIFIREGLCKLVDLILRRI